MKDERLFKRTHNGFLQLLETSSVGDVLGSEPYWADALAVSRTTIRKILKGFAANGVIDAGGRKLARRPRKSDYFPEAETRQIADLVEKQFMRWILHGDCKPGEQINALELARRFGVSTSAVRDYLARFSNFGLLEKRPNGGWMFKGFTHDFAEELFEVRLMFETRSAQRFVELPETDGRWNDLRGIEEEHLALIADSERRYSDFSELDERFHRLVNDASRNRFIVSFYDVISMIFHYHYQWNKIDEKERNIAAAHEHLAYIAALRSRDRAKAAESCRAHMATARRTLIASIPRFA